MRVVPEELDSQAFERNVLQIKEPEARPDFAAFEAGYVDDYQPYYVYVKVPADALGLIHHFEDQGFRFVEFQLEMTKRLSRKYDTSLFDGLLGMSEVGPEEDVEPILRLADEIFTVDRIYRDPALDPELAKRRYRLYITKSWRSPDERLLKLFDLRDGHLMGFHTHMKQTPTAMLHFLGGLTEESRATGASLGFERIMFNNWIDEGIKKVTTHISLANFNVMEAEYKAFDFKPRQVCAVLRKIYPA